MRIYRLLIFILLVSITFDGYAKKEKLGKYTVFEGTYKKGVGAIGAGTLTMATKISALDKLASVGEKQPEPIVVDVLTGYFNGNHVTSATLLFNSKWKFEGTVDFQVETSQDGTDQVFYTLTEGLITGPRYSKHFSNKGIKLKDSQKVVIRREINNSWVSVTSTDIQVVEEANGLSFRGFNISRLIGSTIFGVQQYRFCNKIEISKLAPPPPTYTGQRYSNNTGSKKDELWELDKYGNQEYVNENGESVTFGQKDSYYYINNGSNNVTYSNNNVLKAYVVYKDAKLTYSNKNSTIIYSNGRRYEGTVWADEIKNGGDFTSESKMLYSFLNAKTIKESSIEPCTGVLTDNGKVEKYSYGHKHSSIRPDSFIGTWNVSCGKVPSFDRMNPEGFIEFLPDYTYKWTIKQRDYGSYSSPAYFIDTYRFGTWKIEENNLVLTEQTDKTILSKRVLPSEQGGIKSDILKQYEERARQEVEAENQKFSNMGTGQPSAFDLFTINTTSVQCIINDLTYSFTRRKENNEPQFTRELLIGRWGIADYDQVFDYNADGTYARYDTKKVRTMDWTESFSTCFRGTWQIVDDELIVISDPTQSIVQAKVENPEYWAKAKAPARNKELLNIAAEQQKSYRLSPATGTYSTFVSWNGQVLRLKTASGKVFNFVRLPQQ